MRALLALSLLMLAGCPRDVGRPEPSDEAVPCETFAECNTETCGELSACVDGLCEEGKSLEIPCR